MDSPSLAELVPFIGLAAIILSLAALIWVGSKASSEGKSSTSDPNKVQVETITRTTVGGETTVHVQKYDMPYGYYVSIVPIVAPQDTPDIDSVDSGV